MLTLRSIGQQAVSVCPPSKVIALLWKGLSVHGTYHDQLICTY